MTQTAASTPERQWGQTEKTVFTHPAGFAGRLDRDDDLGVRLSAVLPAVEGGHPEGVNALTLGIQRLGVLNVT